MSDVMHTLKHICIILRENIILSREGHISWQNTMLCPRKYNMDMFIVAVERRWEYK